jgi:hypothetical protein
VQVLASARVGAALAADGTTVTAMIAGKECGSAQITNGFAVLTATGGNAQEGCGVAGATISFKIGEETANESIPWDEQPLAGLVALSATRAVVGGGLVVRPTLQASCISPTGECAPEERPLWTGDRAMWQALLEERGDAVSAGAMLAAWMRFRAERGEVFASIALAALEGRPLTFILAVRHGGTAAEPEPYVSLFNLGADRPAAGWSLRTGSGESFTFPSDAMLRQGQCRIYVNPLDAPDSGAACGGASFPPPGTSLPARGGYVELVDDQGTVIDSVGW